ncbi:hypothetical protein LZC95_01235 [Pendulispora brunnea]|uniref:Uncharacterized protein n=1 Tax=Pendulispora brunnea TaxID=2905690 RepID=A0ABZ2K9U6_9BACT
MDTTSVRFDAAVPAIAYALVPWSPLVPVAFARRPANHVHLGALVMAIVGLAAHASGRLSLVVVAAMLVALFLALRSVDDIERAPAVLVATVAAVGFLVVRDIEAVPARVLEALGQPGTNVPPFTAVAAKTVRIATAATTALTVTILLAPRTWLPVRRSVAILAVAGIAWLGLQLHVYPALRARLSPTAARETWERVHAQGEPLGALGVDPHAITDAPAVTLAHATAAGKWLAETASGRRFVALASPELPRLNAAFRAERRANVPILAGGDGTVMLAASSLASGERSESPLDAVVRNEPPGGLRPIDAVAGNRLELVGWDLRDAHGAPLETASSGKRMHVRLVLRVRSAESLHAYCTFLHIDHTPTRFAAEHREHPYPMPVWQAGDVIVDDFEVTLPPHFRAGQYALWWGIGELPCQDDRRMPVTSGPNDGHGRVRGGSLEVR